MEKVVLEMIRTGKGYKMIAERLKCDPQTIERWEAAYKAAGRAALEKMK